MNMNVRDILTAGPFYPPVVPFFAIMFSLATVASHVSERLFLHLGYTSMVEWTIHPAPEGVEPRMITKASELSFRVGAGVIVVLLIAYAIANRHEFGSMEDNTKTAECAVCGIVHHKEHGEVTVTQGREWRFCSEECQLEFTVDEYTI